MYLKNKSRFKGILGGFMNDVILRSFCSEFRPCKNAKWPGCRVKTPWYNNNINDVILRGCNSGSHPGFITRAGFTLIELLVVVLIIGILAAVALPQYQTAVAKSRAAEALVNLKALYNAQQIYFMSNGSYTAQISNLDFSLPVLGDEDGEWMEASYYKILCNNAFCQAQRKVKNVPSFEVTLKSNIFWCLCWDENKDCRICTNLGGTYDHFGFSETGARYYYKLSL